MSATPKYLQRLNQVGYGLIGTGGFLLLSWINPLDWSPAAGMAMAIALAAAGLYRASRPQSRAPNSYAINSPASNAPQAEQGDSNPDS